MRKLALFPALIAVAAFAADGGAEAPPAQQPPNAVQKEMQALHAMMVIALTAIENGVLSPIPEALERVHDSKSETEKALASGAWNPPRPGTTLKDFARQDEGFHKELEKLEALAKKNDLPGVTKQYGVVLNGCTACHQKFKFIAPPAARSK